MDKVIDYAVLITCVLVISLVINDECFAAEPEFKYHLNLLPVSKHHGDTDTTNERHSGVGFSVTLPNNATYGAMHYTNSYGDDGWMVSTSVKQRDCNLCFGLGVGYAPAYKETDNSTILGWASVSYGWVTILTVPTEVTALVLSIPLN